MVEYKIDIAHQIFLDGIYWLINESQFSEEKYFLHVGSMYIKLRA